MQYHTVNLPNEHHAERDEYVKDAPMPADGSFTLNSLARYARQMRFAPLGEAGQRQMSRSRVLICGCGALGSALVNTLVRAGVGHVRIVDRDVVELSNLHRQSLFDEVDVASGAPKAVAAADKLRRVNSTIEIEAIVAHVDAGNIENLCSGVDVIVDGTDNFETRYLLNDAALHWNIPWVFGGCIGATGQTMTIVPGPALSSATGCLRCLLPECPEPGSLPTCDTAGVLAPIVNVIAAIQSQEAIKLLSGNRQAVSPYLTVVDLWDNCLRQIDISQLRSPDCVACGRRQFDWLSGHFGSRAAVLCGRNAVQLTHAARALPLEQLARSLAGVGNVVSNDFLLRLSVENYDLTIFPDGRAIVHGTSDPALARAIHARYIGS